MPEALQYTGNEMGAGGRSVQEPAIAS